MGEESDGSSSFTDEDDIEDATPLDDVEDEEERLIMQGGAGIPIGPVSCSGSGLREDDSMVFFQDGVPRPLLPPLSPKHAGRKCLVLDLDETLVHSSFKVRESLLRAVCVMNAHMSNSRYNKRTTWCLWRSSTTGITSMSSSALASTTS